MPTSKPLAQINSKLSRRQALIQPELLKKTRHRYRAASSVSVAPPVASAHDRAAYQFGVEAETRRLPASRLGSFVWQLINWNTDEIRLWQSQQFYGFDGLQTAEQRLAHSMHAVHNALFGIDDY